MGFGIQLSPVVPPNFAGTIQDAGRSGAEFPSRTPIFCLKSGANLVDFSSELGLYDHGPAKCSLSFRCAISSARSRLSSCGTVKGLTAAASTGSLEPGIKAGPIRAIKISREPALEQGDTEQDDDDPALCPVECVREFKSREEFDDILRYAKEQNALVVVDFFRTACGSCRYIEKGFTKLCMAGDGEDDVTVIFLKHNVMDEYDEPSEFAEDLRIRVVPMFQFYKDGELVESFATREKTKILDAISKHTGVDLKSRAMSRES